MKVLLTGANGFLGSYITGALVDAGHRVTAAVRNVADFQAKFPKTRVHYIDMNTAVHPPDWAEAVRGQDAVINCAGILQGDRKNNIWHIHHLAPAALFEAAEKGGVKKIVQISAISAEKEVGTDYALSKLAADEDLRERKLNWTVLRPSLVIAANAYGGTALMRQLASFPFMTPVIGKGDQVFQPVIMQDLADIVVTCLLNPRARQQTIDAVGPEIFTISEILVKFRRWLGKKDVPFFHYPLPLAKLSAKMGDILGVGPLRSTSLIHMEYGNVSAPETVPFLENLIGRKLETLDDFLKNNSPDFKGR